MVESLNVNNVKQTYATNLSEDHNLNKKAFKLYQMFWSGLTKYLRSTLRQGKPLELPNFAIFSPVVKGQKLTMKAL